MEKHRPHYPLTEIQSLIQQGRHYLTKVSREGASNLGMQLSDVLQTIKDLTSNDFYKSMTSHGDHKLWQDVYRPDTSFGKIYVKLQIGSSVQVVVVSFKEL